MKIILDMDKFVLEQVYRPYQNELGFSWKDTLQKTPYSLDKTMELLKEDSEWSRLTISRLIGCKFKFNKWLKHPLIDFINNYISH